MTYPIESSTPVAGRDTPTDAYSDQSILHAEGECGNCLQATLASILGWPLDAVPHFALLGEVHWWDCLQSWLGEQGYWIDYKADSFAAEGGQVLPRCWMSGTSPRGFSHAVVGDTASGEMLHDPHPSRAGLVQVDYRIYLFRKPAALSSSPAAGHVLVPIEAPVSLAPILTGNSLSDSGMSARDRQVIEERLQARWASILEKLAACQGPQP